MKNRGCLYPFFALFALAGLFCGVLGVSLAYQHYRDIQEGVKVTATVSDLDYSANMVAPVYQFEDEQGDTVTVHSTVYTSINPAEIGDEVVLYYNPENPEEFALNEWEWLSLLPFLFLFTHGGVGFGGLYWLEKKRRLDRWLQQYGHEIVAKWTKIRERYNKRRYYIIECEWTDPYTKTVYTFESDAMTTNPADQLPPGFSIRILIKPENPKEYWMDTAFLDS